MSRKRRIFDIDLPEDEAPVEQPPEVETKSMTPRRRGPMATAIGETGEALRRRKEIEAEIRAENDALAQEFVRMKKDGLIVDLIPTDKISIGKLTRDRLPGGNLELEDLKASIRELGLSNPIRVEQTENGTYHLIEGFRRLTAYRSLARETGDAKWGSIPAGLVPSGEETGRLYRRMVDENLVRSDISFAEMAALAQAYVRDGVDGCDDLNAAVNHLFASASPQKRSYIRRFAVMMRLIGGDLKFAKAIPRALGLQLADRLEAMPDAADGLRRDLRAAKHETADSEIAMLRAFLAEQDAPLPVKTRGAPKAAARRGRVALTVPVGPGVKCTATDGKMEMRSDVDFSKLDRDQLEKAIEAFFAVLGKT